MARTCTLTRYFSINTAAITAYPLTMVGWFYANAALADQTILSVGDKDDPDEYCSLIAAGNVLGDPVMAYAGAYSGTEAVDAKSSTGFSATTWHHAAGVWRGVSDRSAYIDGGSKGNGTDTVGAMVGHDRTRLGISADSSPGDQMQGSIAHVAIWSTALSDAEIAALAKGLCPLKIRQTSLEGYWPLWPVGTASDPAQDMTWNGLTMTAASTPANGATDPPIQPISGWFRGRSGMFLPETFDGSYESLGAEQDSDVVASGDIEEGVYYRVITGPVTYNGWSYAVGGTFAGVEGETTYTGGTVALHRTFITVFEDLGATHHIVARKGDPTADAYTDVEDECHALDVASWYGIMALAAGRTDRAELALKYVSDHYHTQDPNYPTVKGYPAYLSTDPYTASLSSCYGDVLSHVWSEGTAGVISAWAGLNHARLWREDIRNILGARIARGYQYSTIDNAPVEMKPWADLASTGWMVIASDPNDFWDIDIATLIDLNAEPYFHDYRKNPVLRSEQTIRFLPGAVSSFTAAFSGIDFDLAGNFSVVEGDQRDYFPTARSVVISGATPSTNNGTYKVSSTAIDSNGDTKINWDATVKSIAGDGTVGTLTVDDDAEGILLQRIDREYYDQQYTPAAAFHTYKTRIEAPDLDDLDIDVQLVGTASGDAFADGDVKYYRFSYLYDGVQESLLSEILRINCQSDQMPRFQWSFDSTVQSKRITGINVYRADAAAGPYQLITTINYLRLAANRIQADGAYSGRGRIYIPELSTYNFDGVSVYKIACPQSASAWNVVTIDVPSGTGHTHFTADSGEWWGDVWDGEWYLEDDGTVVEQGATGAYAGKQAIILDDDLGKQAISGGVIDVTNLAAGVISSIATSPTSSVRTLFTADRAHEMVVGDVVYHEGFTDDQYNGYFVIRVQSAADTYEIDVPFIAGATTADGKWIPDGNERVIDDSFEYALHVTQEVSDNYVEDKAYNFSSRLDGTYWFTKSGDTITVTYYDPAITAGTAHPLAGEQSIDVHGRYGVISGRRLAMSYLVLDPHGNPETKSNFLSYSELDQFDVNPVSNIIDLSAAGVGFPTGMAHLMRFVVVAKEQGVLLIDMESNPDDPTSWVVLETVHRIGNLAAEGMISVSGKVYLCSEDGIYALAPGNFAEADNTPTEALRISEAINDTYEALDLVQKAGIKAEYNARTFEIFFTLGSEIYAYSVTDGDWREIVAVKEPDVFGQDDRSNALIYSTQDDKLYSGSFDDAATAAVQSKVFVTSPRRGEPVRGAWVTYESGVALTLNVYLDEATTPQLTYALPARSSLGDHFQAIRARAQRFSLEITVPSTADTVRIDRIRIEHDGEG